MAVTREYSVSIHHGAHQFSLGMVMTKKEAIRIARSQADMRLEQYVRKRKGGHPPIVRVWKLIKEIKAQKI